MSRDESLAANEQDYTAETIKPHLPKRIVVDEKGVYWRDYGEFWSLCPHSSPPEGTETVAVFVPQDEKIDLMRRYAKALKVLVEIGEMSSLPPQGLGSLPDAAAKARAFVEAQK